MKTETNNNNIADKTASIAGRTAKAYLLHGNRGSAGGLWIYEAGEFYDAHGNLTLEEIPFLEGVKEPRRLLGRQIGWAFNVNNNTGRTALWGRIVAYRNSSKYYATKTRTTQELLEFLLETAKSRIEIIKIIEKTTA